MPPPSSRVLSIRLRRDRFEDIADPKYSPERNEGITFEAAMETIHVIKREDSAVVTGMEALTALYEITGMGWLFKLAKLPVLSGAAEIAYKMVSKNRTGMSNAADGLLALGRINMEEKGEGSCTDLEGECREKPPPVDEEEERAAKAAEERRAKMAAEKAEKAKAAGGAAAKTVPTMAKTPPATSAGGLESAARAPKPPSSGALSDRRNILGVYDMRRSKISARALRAAPVDTSTGELIDEVITIPLDDAELSTVANALTAIVKHFGWQGNVGIGLPAVSVGTDSESVNETFDSVDMDAAIDQSFRETDIYAMEEGVAAKKLAERERNERERPDNWGKSRVRAAAKYGEKSMATTAAEVSAASDSRRSRLETEDFLKNAVGRDVVVMTCAEATGFGEMQYGDAGGVKGTATGTTVCVSLGRTIGVSLFDNGILAHNPADVQRQVATWDYPRWFDSPLPRLDEDEDPLEEEWERWANRVDHYLSRIEAVCKPDNFVVCGRASVSFDKWRKYLKTVKTPVSRAEQGLEAAVQGAAVGASEILTLRRDTARVRAAIGHSKGLSPQKLTDEMLEAVFDEFDEDSSGTLSADELNNAISRLGVTLTNAELKELFVEMDSEMTGDIRKGEFVSWWRDSIGSSAVEIIHTMDEYKQVLDDADGTDQMTVLMVGVTYCKPCKAFTTKYQNFAKRFEGARFLKVFGNENKDMTVLCRDELKVKSTPTFYFFRNTEQVHMHTGANAGKFEKFILENLKPGEPGYGSAREFEDPPVEDPKKGGKKTATGASR